MNVAAVVTFTWSGMGYCGGADRYKRSFETSDAAQECMERVLEGRRGSESDWSVVTDSGARRRLGTCDSAFCVNVVDRKAVAA